VELYVQWHSLQSAVGCRNGRRKGAAPGSFAGALVSTWLVACGLLLMGSNRSRPAARSRRVGHNAAQCVMFAVHCLVV
jgi:hypothetical protein